MDWLNAVSDLLKTQEEALKLCEEIEELDQFTVLKEISLLETLSEGLKGLFEPWILKDLQTVPLESEEGDRNELPVAHKDIQRFLQDFNRLLELKENIGANSENKLWLSNQNWPQVIKDLRSLEVRLLRISAQVDRTSDELKDETLQLES